MKNSTLKLLRAQKNWNQEEVAKQLNISIPAYSKIESGVTDVSLSRLREIAALHGLTLTDLVAKIDGVPVKESEIDALKNQIVECKSQIDKLQKSLISVYEEHVFRKQPQNILSTEQIKAILG